MDIYVGIIDQNISIYTRTVSDIRWESTHNNSFKDHFHLMWRYIKINPTFEPTITIGMFSIKHFRKEY